MTRELSPQELKEALAAADRGIRLPWAAILLGASLTALAVGFGQQHFDHTEATHVLIVCAAALLYAQMMVIAGVITSRQNAANARTLRALELLDERLTDT